MSRWILTAVAAAVSLGTTTSLPAKAPNVWDGLTRVQSKRLNTVYLLPNADFREYSKVMIDQPQIAFRKNWQKDYNSQQRDMGKRATEKDVREAIDGGSKAFSEILAQAYAKAGYQVVTQPDADVLRVSTAVINISVNAPDIMSAGRSRSFVSEAGEATLVVEVRDSVSGTLLGRALDRTIVGDYSYMRWSNSVANRSEFELVFKRWAKASAEGVDKLKALSPVR